MLRKLLISRPLLRPLSRASREGGWLRVKRGRRQINISPKGGWAYQGPSNPLPTPLQNGQLPRRAWFFSWQSSTPVSASADLCPQPEPE